MKTSTVMWLSIAAAAILVVMGYSRWAARRNASVRESSPTKHGVVTGIMYAEQRPSAVIGYEIVYEGDTIDGVKVVKIHRDKVEFERREKRWAQGVQEKPNRAWPKAD